MRPIGRPKITQGQGKLDLFLLRLNPGVSKLPASGYSMRESTVVAVLGFTDDVVSGRGDIPAERWEVLGKGSRVDLFDLKA